MRGTEGYAENAASLVGSWQGLSFTDKPESVRNLVPVSPSAILDIGAGIGVDAAAMAAMGHRVVAVEPTDGLREAGMTQHASLAIDWVADGLPNLDLVIARRQRFDLITLWAVWMHLDEPERKRAMRRIVSLLQPSGRLVMSLRHGPVPAGRRMFAVSAEETIDLAATLGLQSILSLEAVSEQESNRLAGVTWTHLAFERR